MSRNHQGSNGPKPGCKEFDWTKGCDKKPKYKPICSFEYGPKCFIFDKEGIYFDLCCKTDKRCIKCKKCDPCIRPCVGAYRNLCKDQCKKCKRKHKLKCKCCKSSNCCHKQKPKPNPKPNLKPCGCNGKHDVKKDSCGCH